MALVKCSECGGQVSDQAPACPHCGAARKVKQKTTGCAWIALVFLILFFFFSCKGAIERENKRAAAPSAPPAPRITDEQCKQTLKCWGEKHFAAASVKCANAIEREAKYQSEWTDGMLGTKFPSYAWGDQTVGSVKYIGDKIKFQNGFGAWQTMNYICLYNPGTQQVTVAVYPR